MVCIGQITTNPSSTAGQVAIVAAGILVLYVAFKIGFVILKIVLGLVGLAVIAGSLWWLISGMQCLD